MTDTCAVAAVVGSAIAAILLVGTFYLRTRFTPPPPGRHSEAGIEARKWEPVDVMDWVKAYCTAEDRYTKHARLRTGGTVCATTGCHNPLEGECAR